MRIRSPGVTLAIAALSVAPLCAAAPSAASVADLPVVPSLRGALAAHVQAIAATGAALGDDPHVFAKVGDSITESGSFLQDLACQPAKWGSWGGLRTTRHFFGTHTFPSSYTSVWCGRANSFSRASLAAVSGWDATTALGPLHDPPVGCRGRLAHPLDCELHLLHPAVALVMYGTNDLERFSAGAFARNLRAVAQRAIAAGTIPVLSTIPPRLDTRRHGNRVGRFNDAIAFVAESRRLPLWNYWRQLQAPGMVNHGIDDDGIHPNVFGGCHPPLGCRSTTLTDAGLRYGYNQRNLGALRVLDLLRRRVLAR